MRTRITLNANLHSASARFSRARARASAIAANQHKNEALITLRLIQEVLVGMVHFASYVSRG